MVVVDLRWCGKGGSGGLRGFVRLATLVGGPPFHETAGRQADVIGGQFRGQASLLGDGRWSGGLVV